MLQFGVELLLVSCDSQVQVCARQRFGGALRQRVCVLVWQFLYFVDFLRRRVACHTFSFLGCQSSTFFSKLLFFCHFLNVAEKDRFPKKGLPIFLFGFGFLLQVDI